MAVAAHTQAFRDGNALQQQARYTEAIARYDCAIALKPSVAAYTNRGNALRQLKRTEQALESYERALALDPQYAEIHNNRGSALQELGRLEEALASYQRAIELKPGYAEANNNLGVTLTKLKRIDEAMAAFEQALALKADYAEAIWNRGLARLLMGQYASGWPDYEARKKKRAPVGDRPFARPLWLGDAPIAGKTILVHWEQGYGDTIQFSRYVGLLADAGATVLFAPQRPLQRLMQTLDARVRIVDLDDEPLPPFDCHCPLMSLPLAFGTELRSIPSASAYLQADRATVDTWRAVMGERRGPRIGVVWSGRAEPDRNRSIDFAVFAQLFDERYRFISLQKDISDDDRRALAAANIFHLGDELRDFSDTAAACSLMDLVISVDTALAHLAGALAIPVWILLPHVPDWRWMLDRADTPWYPTMRLFRQQQRGAWHEVVRRVHSELGGRLIAWPRQ